MKGKLKGNILAFLTHVSVTFALRTCGRKLANEPKSDKYYGLGFRRAVYQKNRFLVCQQANSFDALLTKNGLFLYTQTDKTKF